MKERYEFLDSKIVQDVDGSDIDYTLYKDNERGVYFTIFGDRENNNFNYTPNYNYVSSPIEKTDAYVVFYSSDKVFDVEDVAREYFNKFNGYEEEQ